MKITRVKPLVVAAPPHRNWIFVKVETDQPGLYGWGEATLEWKTRGVVGCVEDFEPIVVGRDPRNVTQIVELLNKAAFWPLGVIGLTALSAIEQAVWDIKAKDMGVPVWQALGGQVRDRVRVYTHIGAGKLKIDRGKRDIGEYRESAAELKEAGYTALKTGPVPYTHYDPDLAAVRHAGKLLEGLRDAVGDSVDILLDFHGRPSSMAAALRLYRRRQPGPADVRRGADSARRSGGHAHDRRARRMPDRHRRAHPDPQGIRRPLQHEGGHLHPARPLPLRRLHHRQADRRHRRRELHRRVPAQSDGADRRRRWPAFRRRRSELRHSRGNHRFDTVVLRGRFHRRSTASTGIWEIPTAPGLGVEIDEAVAAKHPFQQETIAGLEAVVDRDGTIANW